MRRLPGDTFTFEITTEDSATAAAVAEAAGPGLFVTRRMVARDGATLWFAGGLVAWEALPRVADVLRVHVSDIESIRVDDRHVSRPARDDLVTLLAPPRRSVHEPRQRRPPGQ